MDLSLVEKEFLKRGKSLGFALQSKENDTLIFQADLGIIFESLRCTFIVSDDCFDLFFSVVPFSIPCLDESYYEQVNDYNSNKDSLFKAYYTKRATSYILEFHYPMVFIGNKSVEELMDLFQFLLQDFANDEGKASLIDFIRTRVNQEDDLFDVDFGAIMETTKDDDSLLNKIDDGFTIEDGVLIACHDHDGRNEIVIPAGVTSIGDGVFSERPLTRVVIPYGLTSIGDSAFFNCEFLSSLVMPNSVTRIKDNAFGCCSSLTNIVIPDSVTSIERDVFSYCTSLSSIAVDEDNEVYDSRNGCNAIIETKTNKLVCGCKNTVIPNDVTSIGEGAFCGCRSLRSIVIPKSVTSMGKAVFSDCGSLMIYCEVSSKPDGWDDNWNPDNRPVVWGYKSNN